MTVSRVLNRTVYVSPEATQRVKTAIEKLGYRPNELARSLRSRRSRTIGLIIPSLHDALFANCAHAMSILAKEHNYSLVVSVAGEDPSTEVFEAEQLLRRGVDGVSIISSRFHESRIASSFAGEKPVVVFDRSLYRLAASDVLRQRNSDSQCIAQQLSGRWRLPVGIVGRNWRLYQVREERHLYYMTVRDEGAAAKANAEGSSRESKANNGHRANAAAIECATLFSSNFEPTHLCLGEFRSTEISLDQFDNCHSVEILYTGLTETCKFAQDMGQVAASLLLVCIERQSHSKRQG